MSNTKKSLLNENTIRRFMKLAEIDKLSDGFVTGLVNEEVHSEEFEGDPEGLDDGPSGLEAAADDAAELDMGPEEAPEADRLAAAVSDLMTVVSDMTGVEIDVDGGEDEAAMPAEDDLAVADAGVEDEVDVMAEEAPAPAATQEESLRRDEAYRHALKQEVYNRVSARLQQESRKDAIADQLSERILQRIKNQPKK